MSRSFVIKQCKTISNISPDTLRDHLAKPGCLPLRLPSIIDNWPGIKNWELSDDLQALRTAVGETREVEVELGPKGRGYLDPNWQRVTMGFGLFLDAFILSKIPSTSSGQIPSGYLAQSDLLDLAPDLSKSVPPMPHFKAGPKETVYRRTMWIGPSGSFTPFHRDPYIGLYSQVLGHKVFHLLPPSAARLLDISPIPRHKNTSQIPLPVSQILQEDQGPSHSPSRALSAWREGLRSAFQLEGACEARLGPGDSVLVPEGWFHSAEGGDGPSIGVGAWFK